jgi:hypothetical protein
MKPADIFGLIVRTIGLALLLYGFWYLMSAAIYLISPSPEYPAGALQGYLTSGVSILVVSLIFLKGAPFLTRFAYPQRTSD